MKRTWMIKGSKFFLTQRGFGSKIKTNHMMIVADSKAAAECVYHLQWPDWDIDEITEVKKDETLQS